MLATHSAYPGIRSHLSGEYAELSDHAIEGLFARGGADAEAMEGFFNDIGKFAKKLAPTVLPMAGTVIGGAFGGPIGASLGSSLGGLAGRAVGGNAGAPAGGGGGPLGAITGLLGGALGGGGGSAAGKLLGAITQPSTLNALGSMALGAFGKQNIPVGGKGVPVSAFTNLLGSLLGRAEAEYQESLAATAGQVPRYMQDFAGEARGDPAISDHRAEALYELLRAEAVENESEASESAEAYESESGESESEAWEAEYDALELQEAIAEAEGFESEGWDSEAYEYEAV